MSCLNLKLPLLHYCTALGRNRITETSCQNVNNNINWCFVDWLKNEFEPSPQNNQLGLHSKFSTIIFVAIQFMGSTCYFSISYTVMNKLRKGANFITSEG